MSDPAAFRLRDRAGSIRTINDILQGRSEKTVEAMLAELEQKARTQLAARQEAGHWAEIIRQYTEITELDETILFALVDRIEVGETTKQGNTRTCEVKVFYRYVGNVDAVMAETEAAG